LLLRFYDPKSGTVLFDGRDIRTLNIRWLRSQMGYVGQEPVLFAGSIFDNIAYGLDPASYTEVKMLVDTTCTEDQKREARAALKERIVEAAKQANAHEFISNFPLGYDTDVGSSGLSMSGGQKQRIAIARALVKKPAVLLLDEATSALDAASERLVQESIDKLQKSKNQTTIIIAHRLSTIRQADQIAVVSNGVIAELGDHDTLIANPNGIYADLVKLQMASMGDLDDAPPEEDDVALPIEEEPVATTGRSRARTSSADKSKPRSGTVESAGGKSPRSGSESSPLAVEEKEPIDAGESKMISRRMWKLVMAHPWWLFAGVLGSAVFGAVFPVWGFMLAKSQQMFYLSSGSKIRHRAAELAYYYILLGGVVLISAIFQYWGIAQVTERVTMKLRSEMFEAILRREVGYFDQEENAVGNLTSRLANDSRLVNKCTGETLAKELQAIFTLAVGLALGFAASWKITLVVLATFPLMIASSAVRSAHMRGQVGDDQEGEELSNAGGVISTAFCNMRTVHAFSVQFKVASQYAQVTRTGMKKKMKSSDFMGLSFGASNMVLFMNYALLFWYGSTLIKSGQISFEQLMQSIFCLMLGAVGLGQAFNDMGDQDEGLRAARRIFRAVDEGILSPIDGLSTQGTKPPTRAAGRIQLIDVNFTYPTRPDVQVCKNYNLVIEPGEVVALVGPSGSGKSTIMNLLLRFYDPASGKVLLDGVDVKTLNVRWLRSQIGYVGQEPVLFQGSVASNIAKGRAEFGDLPVLTLEQAMAEVDAEAVKTKTSAASKAGGSGYENVSQEAGDIEMGQTSEVPEDVIEAAKASNAHDFIMQFSNKYETDVGEGSIMVSGGQKQRIAIARALIKKPAVLLLDEATSALDATSEKLVQESIDALQKSKQQTTIVIAHRLTTIMNADKIAVIDKGAVVELGKHDELLALDGLYATLWHKQKNVGTKDRQRGVLGATSLRSPKEEAAESKV
jgi:ABC-type multidrug transport system fused ATPase/permease subunit